MHEQFSKITVENLRKIARENGHFKTAAMTSRCALYQCIEQAEVSIQNAICDVVSAQLQAGRTRYASTRRQPQNKRSFSETASSIIARVLKRRRRYSNATTNEERRHLSTNADLNSNAMSTSDLPSPSYSSLPNNTLHDTTQSEGGNAELDAQIERLIQSDFMRAPSETVIKDALSSFIDKTNNAAVTMGSCACCAREWNCEDLYQYHVDNIPNRRHLSPSKPHPKHDLFNGALLYPPAINRDGIADICSECEKQLKNDKLPKFALANGMWVGEVPPELSNLTLPERMLIAKYFPAAYIVKLYPKAKGSGGWKRSQLHSGLRGNVSTYILDPKQVASMVEGPVMPPPAMILPATIGITFIGPKGLPESTMPGMFRVRRERIRKALLWLKENNPLYADIVISEARLEQLPINGIPEELTRTAKFSEDIDAVRAEHASYVPDQEDSDEGSYAL
jgi:hypothetical protein